MGGNEATTAAAGPNLPCSRVLRRTATEGFDDLGFERPATEGEGVANESIVFRNDWVSESILGAEPCGGMDGDVLTATVEGRGDGVSFNAAHQMPAARAAKHITAAMMALMRQLLDTEWGGELAAPGCALPITSAEAR